MLKRNLLIILIIFFSTNIFAEQNCLKKGYDELNKDKFKSAAKILNNCTIDSVEDFILYYGAKANLFSGNVSKALQNIDLLLEKYKSFPLVNDVYLLKAKTYFKQRKYKDSAKIMGEKIIKRKNATFKDYMLYCNALFMDNEHANAKKVLNDSINKIKKPSDYAEVMSWMKIMKLHLDEETAYEASLALFNSGRWVEANELVEQNLKAWPNSLQLKILLGRIKYRFDELDEAIQIFTDVKKHSTGRTRFSADNWLATVYAKMNNFESAIKIRKEQLKSARGNNKLNLQHMVAFLYSDAQNHVKAIDEWNNLLTISKKSKKYTAIGMWGLAWSYYKSGDYNLAISTLKSIKENSSILNEVGSEKVDYWMARSFEKQKNKAEAKKIYSSLKSDNGYYGFIASFRNSGKNLVDVPWPNHSTVKQCSGPEIDFTDRINSLKGVDEAFRSVLKFNGRANSAYIAYENDYYDISYNIGRALYNGYLIYPPNSNSECLAWKTIYVRPYKKIVSQLTDKVLPDSLVYGIMMSESSFIPDIESPVGAVGLMQIMPTTAEKISKSLGVKSEVDLTNPVSNISLGTYYLRSLLEKYPLHMTIASYNAGENAVERWMISRKGWEMDQFVEDIPYKETRDYVKKVLGRTWNYERINIE